jgi:hypothetical protein
MCTCILTFTNVNFFNSRLFFVKFGRDYIFILQTTFIVKAIEEVFYFTLGDETYGFTAY